MTTTAREYDAPSSPHSDLFDRCAYCSHPYCNKSELTKCYSSIDYPVKDGHDFIEIGYICHACKTLRLTAFHSNFKVDNLVSLVILYYRPSVFRRKCMLD
jgi:hypothetical protein